LVLSFLSTYYLLLTTYYLLLPAILSPPESTCDVKINEAMAINIRANIGVPFWFFLFLWSYLWVSRLPIFMGVTYIF